ncbi:uncharacterized protein LOC110863473 isoform X2 [Folsomia candida]|uniref:uncharacterized protein LOC110863473 isoform X2 n=1 Tax=Folsomia candida TaxID=158441 RepID=UPI000B90077C|nr:uncharacterized protein LOC110863473 isoform X2 [Folsomia candida]
MCEKSRWNNHVVRTVSRGVLCSRVEEKWAEIRKMADEVQLEELTRFVSNLKDCDDFGGVLHRNTFRVNRKIGVVGLGFFGPHLVNLASYDVAITIEDLRQRSRRIFATEFYNVPAFKSQMFYVTFDNMIVLEPNRFYNIGFQLDGPKTGILDPIKVIQTVSELHVEFAFLRGSLQMPEIKYVILD